MLYVCLMCKVLDYGIQCHFQQYFSYMYIVAVSFIGGGNHSTPRKPLTYYMTASH